MVQIERRIDAGVEQSAAEREDLVDSIRDVLKTCGRPSLADAEIDCIGPGTYMIGDVGPLQLALLRKVGVVWGYLLW